MLNHVMQFSNLKKTHFFEAENVTIQTVLEYWKILTYSFLSESQYITEYKYTLQARGEPQHSKKWEQYLQRSCLYPKHAALPALLQRQKQMGSQGSKLHRRELPGRVGERKKEENFFFFNSQINLSHENTFMKQVLTSIILSFWNFFCKDTKWKSRAANYE